MRATTILLFILLFGCKNHQFDSTKNKITIQVFSAYSLASVYENILQANESIIKIKKQEEKNNSSSLLQQIEDENAKIEGSNEYYKKQFPIFMMLRPNIISENGENRLAHSVILGYSEFKDTVQTFEYLNHPEVKSFFPENLEFKYYSTGLSLEMSSLFGRREKLLTLDDSVIDSILVKKTIPSPLRIFRVIDKIQGDEIFQIDIKLKDGFIDRIEEFINDEDSLFGVSFNYQDRDYAVSISLNQLNDKGYIQLGSSFGKDFRNQIKKDFRDKYKYIDVENETLSPDKIRTKDIQALKNLLKEIGGESELVYNTGEFLQNDSIDKYVELVIKNCPWVIDYGYEKDFVANYAAFHLFKNLDSNTIKEYNYIKVILKYPTENNKTSSTEFNYPMLDLMDINNSYNRVNTFFKNIKSEEFNKASNLSQNDINKDSINQRIFNTIKDAKDYEMYNFASQVTDSLGNDEENILIYLFNYSDESQRRVDVYTEKGNAENLISGIEIVNE